MSSSSTLKKFKQNYPTPWEDGVSAQQNGQTSTPAPLSGLSSPQVTYKSGGGSNAGKLGDSITLLGNLGLTDLVFGRAPSQTVTKHSLLDPIQEASEGYLGNLFAGGPGAVPQWQAPVFDVAGTAPTSLTTLEQFAANSPYLSAAQDYLSAALASGAPRYDAQIDPSVANLTSSAGYLADQLNRDPNEWLNAFQTGVAQPATRSFTENVLPEISAGFGATPGSFWSSQRLNAQNRAVDAFTQGLSEAAARYGYDASQQAANRNLAAAQSAQQSAIQGAGLAQGAQQQGQQLTAAGLDQFNKNALQAAGLSGSALQSGQLDALKALLGGQQEQQSLQYKDFLNQQQYPLDIAKLLVQFLGTPTTENIVFNDEGSEGIIGDVLGIVSGLV